MSQRDSGYERKERDCYETPEWVTDALMPHVPRNMRIWEPAAGTGKMVRALLRAGHLVDSSDIVLGQDFFSTPVPDASVFAIITNPPYESADRFIARAIDLMAENGGIVSMLLRTDFDHAKSRQSLFGNSKQFAKKLVLTKRIKWFENSEGSPSFNHAWFIWNWRHSGDPTIVYA